MLAADQMWPVGVCFPTVPAEQLAAALPRLRILVTVFDRDFADPLKKALREWVNGGGVWIAIGGTCGLGDLLGADVLPPEHASWGGGANNLGEGYLVAARETKHPITAHLEHPLHFFGGLVVRATTSQ